MHDLQREPDGPRPMEIGIDSFFAFLADPVTDALPSPADRMEDLMQRTIELLGNEAAPMVRDAGAKRE